LTTHAFSFRVKDSKFTTMDTKHSNLMLLKRHVNNGGSMVKYLPFIHNLPVKKKYIQEQLPLYIEKEYYIPLQEAPKEEKKSEIEIIELF
jgi:hypothetical protein